MRTTNRILSVSAVILIGILLVGCGGLPSFDLPTDPTTPVSEKTKAPKAPKIERLVGDLDKGTAIKTIPSGAGDVTIRYWTDTDVYRWSADKSVPIYVSISFDNSVETRVYTLTSLNIDSSIGSLRSDAGSFAVTPPFSYDTAFILPVQEVGVRYTEIVTSIDFVVETFAGSGVFTRVSVIDTLLLTFAPEPVKGPLPVKSSELP